MGLFDELDSKILETKDSLNNLVDRFNKFGDLDESFQKTSNDLNTSIKNLSSSNTKFQEVTAALQSAVMSLNEASIALKALEPSKMISKLGTVESHVNDQIKNIQNLREEIKETKKTIGTKVTLVLVVSIFGLLIGIFNNFGLLKGIFTKLFTN